MIDFSFLWLWWWIDISCKSLLLGGVAYLAILLLRLRDPNVKHRIWTGVLCGMCCLPLLVLVTPRLSLPSWLQLPPQVLGAKQAHFSAVAESPEVAHGSVENTVLFEANSAWSDENPLAQQLESLHEQIPHSTGTSVTAVSTLVHSKPPTDSISSPATMRERLASLAVVAVLAQVVVSLFLLLRVATGLLLSQRIIARATPLNNSEHGLPKGILLLQSNEISVPVTIGFLKPRILLPRTWNQWH